MANSGRERLRSRAPLPRRNTARSPGGSRCRRRAARAGAEAQRRAAALDAAQDHAARRRSLARMDGQDQRARRSARRRPRAARPAPRPCGSWRRCRPGAAMAVMKRAQRSRSPPAMALASALMASRPPCRDHACDRADWPARSRSFRPARRAPAGSPRGRATSASMRRTRSDRPLRAMLARASAASCGSRSTSVTCASAMRRATARPTTPTPAPTSSTRSPAPGMAAAAPPAARHRARPDSRSCGCRICSAPPRKASSVRCRRAAGRSRVRLSVLTSQASRPASLKACRAAAESSVADQQAARERRRSSLRSRSCADRPRGWRCRPPAAPTRRS